MQYFPPGFVEVFSCMRNGPGRLWSGRCRQIASRCELPRCAGLLTTFVL